MLTTREKSEKKTYMFSQDWHSYVNSCYILNISTYVRTEDHTFWSRDRSSSYRSRHSFLTYVWGSISLSPATMRTFSSKRGLARYPLSPLENISTQRTSCSPKSGADRYCRIGRLSSQRRVSDQLLTASLDIESPICIWKM